MSKFRTTPLHALLAAAILGLLVMPLAFAGAADGPTATASAPNLAKQVKKLKKRIAKLERRSTAPSGPAGGDLRGNYPNPRIAANSIDGDKVADGSVGIDDLNASTHLKCAASYQYLQGACFQTAARPQQSFIDARGDCAIVGGRVATLAEYESYKRSGGTIGGTVYALEPLSATSAITYDNSANIGIENNTATPHPFHCVINPTG